MPSADRLALAAADVRRMAAARRSADQPGDATAAVALERIADEMPVLAGTEIAKEFEAVCAAISASPAKVEIASNWVAFLLLTGRAKLPSGVLKPVPLPADAAGYLAMLIGLASQTAAMVEARGATRH